MKNVYLCLAILLLPAMASATPAVQPTKQVKLDYQFTQSMAPTGWSATKGVSLTPSQDGLSLKASNWDSKIYRAIELSAGRYNIYGQASGAVHILLRKNFNSKPILNFNLSSAKDKWRTDYADIQLPQGRYLLIVKLHGKDVAGRIKWLRVETAPPQSATTQEAMPTPEEFASMPPPPIVRGFNVTMKLDAKDYAAARQWGANVVRLQIFPTRWAKKHHKTLWEAFPDFLDALDQKVAEAQANGLKVVIDLHELPVENVSRDLDAKHQLWTKNTQLLEKSLIRTWQGIAKKLQPRKDAVWGYDLLNEPLDRRQLPWTPRQWRPIAAKLVEAIRKVDSTTWIIYEPGPGGMFRGIDQLTPLPDTRVIYSVHFYYPSGFTHQGIYDVTNTDLVEAMKKIHVHYPGKIGGREWNKQAMAKILKPVDDFQAKWHVPIYIGEFSVIRWAPRPDSARWLDDAISLFEQRGWSWTYHAFREWPGWSLEDAPVFWKKGMPTSQLHQPATQPTERGKVVREFLQRNQDSAAVRPATTASQKSPYRILFIGDSITHHGIAPKLEWTHFSGMAASSLGKDYVHLLIDKVQKSIPNRQVMLLYGSLRAVSEFKYSSLGQYRRPDKAPDLVVVQAGEHDPQKEGEATIKAGFDKLLTTILALPGPPQVICTGAWAPPYRGGPYKDGQAYEGWAKTRDAIIAEACKKQGIPFVSVMDLATNPENRGYGKVNGVKWHPNDRGHAGYAQKIFETWQRLGISAEANKTN